MTTVDDLHILDNAGKTLDRFTVVWPDGSYLGMSERPQHPQGFGQHGEGIDMNGTFDHLGRVIAFDNLPDECREAVLNDLYEENSA